MKTLLNLMSEKKEELVSELIKDFKRRHVAIFDIHTAFKIDEEEAEKINTHPILSVEDGFGVYHNTDLKTIYKMLEKSTQNSDLYLYFDQHLELDLKKLNKKLIEKQIYPIENAISFSEFKGIHFENNKNLHFLKDDKEKISDEIETLLQLYSRTYPNHTDYEKALFTRRFVDYFTEFTAATKTDHMHGHKPYSFIEYKLIANNKDCEEKLNERFTNLMHTIFSLEIIKPIDGDEC